MSATVGVALAGRSYEVAIGKGLLAQAGDRIRPLLPRPLLAVVVDETVRRLHGAALEESLAMAGIEPRFVAVPSGEAAKSFAGLEDLCERLIELELDRGDVIAAFGGGVVGDLAGFAAAIFKRGIDFIQIPTTLLAQVDSSVGGKTAIDSKRGKNLIGAFHQPRLVLADLSLLSTLPRREIACGYAEIVKCALLGEAAFFAWLESHGPAVMSLEEEALEEAVARSVKMKARVVAADEREAGERALLNLGHTFGHALEAASGFSDALKHGEAVALGCCLALRFSAAAGRLCAEAPERAERVLAAAGLPIRLSDLSLGLPSAAELISSMAADKKAEGGRIALVLLRRIGAAFVERSIDHERLAAFLVSQGASP
ncbi:MAG: 3-dehydroquinate synthase [Caulobacteraceae bacterium]